MSDEEWVVKPKGDAKITVGEDLTPFSKDDLEARIEKLNEEIERVKSAIKNREEQSKMAQNLFNSGT
jgi:uncharacterized small protein (DUF1192 family)